MPTYDFVCSQCGHTIEKIVSIIEPKKNIKCPWCNKVSMVRQIGPGGNIIFRGSGFHCNDYPK
jgi:putative FmdB family regulatory protein